MTWDFGEEIRELSGKLEELVDTYVESIRDNLIEEEIQDLKESIFYEITCIMEREASRVSKRNRPKN